MTRINSMARYYNVDEGGQAILLMQIPTRMGWRVNVVNTTSAFA